MTEMVERVATVLFPERFVEGASPFRTDMQSVARLKACAAILAMREPTQEVAEIMDRHAANGMVDWRDLHNAMIEAVLGQSHS